jgi:hypothetical protein
MEAAVFSSTMEAEKHTNHSPAVTFESPNLLTVNGEENCGALVMTKSVFSMEHSN